MDALFISRLQFAMTTSFHFLFVPLTLGLGFFIAILETAYIRTILDPWKTYLKGLIDFFGKIFVINFAMGVVTGIVLEFHFGMNWSEYSRFMGDIFGAPLALEALTAFFLESTFMGLWIFGRDKLSPRIHCLTIWLVAIGSCISAFWILVANAFMQHPVGFELEDGRVVLKSFSELITNPYVIGEYSHAMFAGISTAGTFIVAICAWKILHVQNSREPFEKCLIAGAIYLGFGILGTMGSGHMHTQYLAQANPMKLSSIEALWETENPAPFAIIADVNQTERRNNSEITVPGLFSFMVYNKFDGEIRGINQLQAESEENFGKGNYTPPVRSLFWSFRIMVASGGALISVAGLIILLYWKRKSMLEKILRFIPLILPLPFIANTVGWYIAEVGRQPWIVVGLQKTTDALSPNITTNQVLLTLIGFTILYTIIAILAIYAAVRFIRTFEIVYERSES
ncbi:MAG: cytochrome ubiquinol oxidase subunit I [Selenomonadaceae bacterium]|nr:cytochrome ubiquinol oxidase subunit I [Selenomonadaceae bacterium]